MANEDKKDFNAMLHKETDMPKTKILTDKMAIQKGKTKIKYYVQNYQNALHYLE